MHESMTESDVAKVDVNAKADTPDASDSSKGSKIDTPNIDLKRGIGKMCNILIVLYQLVSLAYKALSDAKSDGEGADTGKFDTTIDAKK